MSTLTHPLSLVPFVGSNSKPRVDFPSHKYSKVSIQDVTPTKSKSNFLGDAMHGAGSGFFAGAGLATGQIYSTNRKAKAIEQYNADKVAAYEKSGLPSYMAYSNTAPSPPVTATIQGNIVHKTGNSFQSIGNQPSSYLSQASGFANM